MKRLGCRVLALAGIVALLTPQAGQAVITFNQLDTDIFIVSHRVKIIGSRGQATRLVYEKAASLCVAAGYSHLKVLQQDSEASQRDDSANATLRVQLYFEDGEGRIDCEPKANVEYVAQARAKLAKRGYEPPEIPAPGDDGTPAEGTVEDWSCTIEQISAMVRAGFSDPQIKAACPNSN